MLALDADARFWRNDTVFYAQARDYCSRFDRVDIVTRRAAIHNIDTLMKSIRNAAALAG